MSSVVNEFITNLQGKVAGQLQGKARIDIDEEGCVMLTEDGARESSEAEEADVVLSARADVFRGILEGDVNATMAFMTGKLRVDGSSTRALKVAEILTN